MVGRALLCAPIGIDKDRRARSDAPYLCVQIRRQGAEKALNFVRVSE
jgi:hypothetical protein